MTSLPADKSRLRLVLVDDSEVVRMGLRSLLGAEPSIEVVGEAENVARAVDVCTRVTPDVVLLDIRLPDGFFEFSRVPEVAGGLPSEVPRAMVYLRATIVI